MPVAVSTTISCGALEPRRCRGRAARPATRAGAADRRRAACASIDCTRSRSASTSSRALGLEAHRAGTGRARRAHRRSRSSPSTGCSPRGARRRRSTSRSISVTSAPSVAATVAQVLPAGPPPMITSRVRASAQGTRSARSVRPRLRMPELRDDALTGRSVIVRRSRAAARTVQPHRSRRRTRVRGPATARSAPGTSTQTPPESHRTGSRRTRHARLAGARRAEPLPDRRAPTRHRGRPAARTRWSSCPRRTIADLRRAHRRRRPPRCSRAARPGPSPRSTPATRTCRRS